MLRLKSNTKQKSKHSGVLAAVTEGLCNCSEGAQMLHAGTVVCVADPTSSHPREWTHIPAKQTWDYHFIYYRTSQYDFADVAFILLHRQYSHLQS